MTLDEIRLRRLAGQHLLALADPINYGYIPGIIADDEEDLSQTNCKI